MLLKHLGFLPQGQRWAESPHGRYPQWITLGTGIASFGAAGGAQRNLWLCKCSPWGLHLIFPWEVWTNEREKTVSLQILLLWCEGLHRTWSEQLKNHPFSIPEMTAALVLWSNPHTALIIFPSTVQQIHQEQDLMTAKAKFNSLTPAAESAPRSPSIRAAAARTL